MPCPVSTTLSRIVLALVAFLVGILAISAVFLFGQTTKQTQVDEWLFTYGATSAELDVNQADRSGQLRLVQPDATLLMFTDRPERRTATIAIDSLAAQWDQVFATSAPNAALVDDSSGDAVAVLTLARPQVADDSVIFPVTITELPARSVSRQWDQGVHLFIDPPAARLTDFHEVPMANPELLPSPAAPELP